MSALSAARLLTAGSAWRLVGLTPAGRALVSAVAGSAADDRAIAGILLTRAGDRSVPLISEALTTGADPTDLVNVLASIATPDARAALQTATLSTRPEVAAAAREALHTLDQQPHSTD